MDRTLVISDIHGCFFQFIDLLNRVGYNADTDRLILLGDYVDRGNASKEVVETVLKLVQGSNVVALRGNHDQRFVDFMMGDDECAARFFQHGGMETLRSYARIDDEANWQSARESIREQYPHHLSFLSSLPLYHEDDQHIFVHAGLNPEYANWKEQPIRDFMWIREKFINQETSVNKTVIFGHTKTMDIHGSDDIWFGGDKIGIDGGCSFGQQLNCLEIRKNCDYVTHVRSASAITDTESI